MTREAVIQHDIRLGLGTVPGLVLWRNNVGLTGHSATCTKCGHREPDSEDGPRIRYGLCRGSSDLIGILAPAGRFVAMEIKNEAGRVTPEQEMFIELVRARGGFACVVRSVAEAVAAVERARTGAAS